MNENNILYWWNSPFSLPICWRIIELALFKCTLCWIYQGSRWTWICKQHQQHTTMDADEKILSCVTFYYSKVLFVHSVAVSLLGAWSWKYFGIFLIGKKGRGWDRQKVSQTSETVQLCVLCCVVLCYPGRILFIVEMISFLVPALRINCSVAVSLQQFETSKWSVNGDLCRMKGD